MNPVKQILSELRGQPAKCDFCEQPKSPDELEPEEAGMWVCHECQERWDKQEKEEASK